MATCPNEPTCQQERVQFMLPYIMKVQIYLRLFWQWTQFHVIACSDRAPFEFGQIGLSFFLILLFLSPC